MSDVYTREQRAERDSRKPRDKPEYIRIPRNGCIKVNSPGRSTKLSPEKAERSGKDADALIGHMQVRNARIDMITTAKIV